MRRLLSLTLALLFALPVAARDRGPDLHWFINGGPTSLSSPERLDDTYNTGWGVGFGTFIRDDDLPFLLSVEAQYNQFAVDEDELEDRLGGFVDVDGGTLHLWGASVGARYVLRREGKIHPFVGGELGLFHVQTSDFSVSTGGLAENLEVEGNTDLGYTLLAGLMLRISDDAMLLIEPRYSFVRFDEARDLEYVPVRIGIMLR